MDERKARENICQVGRMMWQRNLVASNDGNISVRISADRVICTPTGVSKGFMQPENLCLLSIEGEWLDGPKPSIETPMHTWVYRARADVQAVVHAHPPYVTAYSSCGRSIPTDILTEMALGLGEVPLVEHGTPGSMDVPALLEPIIDAADVFLIANHGALTVGKDVFDAYFKMESVELCAQTTFIAEQLGPKRIPQDQLDTLFQMRRERIDAGRRPNA
ncbi:MAG: class II aldolase/adducin family protein [Armatimonadetes bacterium]|nr:class II aldolase/adducin family protein [Armatimonadota bacterium]MDI9583050.1 class II aldolase/adducin family protein [Acidobacteriota bacterium]